MKITHIDEYAGIVYVSDGLRIIELGCDKVNGRWMLTETAAKHESADVVQGLFDKMPIKINIQGVKEEDLYSKQSILRAFVAAGLIDQKTVDEHEGRFEQTMDKAKSALARADYFLHDRSDFKERGYLDSINNLKALAIRQLKRMRESGVMSEDEYNKEMAVIDPKEDKVKPKASEDAISETDHWVSSIGSNFKLDINNNTYSAYKINVSDLEELDIYELHNRFKVDDPSGCIQHASKKLLLAGTRTGGKSKCKDIQEASDTLNRWLEINNGNKH